MMGMWANQRAMIVREGPGSPKLVAASPLAVLALWSFNPLTNRYTHDTVAQLRIVNMRESILNEQLDTISRTTLA